MRVAGRSLLLLGLALGGCKSPPATISSSTAEPPSTFVETETVVENSEALDSSAPPVPGLDYWAHPRLAPSEFVAEVRAGGLDLRHEVEVHDTRELFAALASNTLIWLHPGRYVLDQADEIRDLHDLALVGVGPKPAVIIQPDSYASVLSFVNVNDLALYNLALGHRPEQGWCQGDVVRAVECQSVLIAGTTLFGSGTEGLSLVTVEKLSLRDSVITDCSEQFSTISNSREVRYENVEVAGNRGDLLRGFAIYRSTVTLDHVEIVDNHPLKWTSSDSYDLLFAIDGGYDWGEWFVDSPRVPQPAIGASVVELMATTIEGERYDQQL